MNELLVLTSLISTYLTYRYNCSIIKVANSVIPEQKITFFTPEVPKMSICQKIGFGIGYLVVAPFEFVNSMIEAYDVNDCHISESKLSPNIKLAFSDRIPMGYIKEIKRIHGTGFSS